MTRTMSDTMRGTLRAIARGDTLSGRDRTRDALRRRGFLAGTGTGVYVTPAGLEALGFTLETVKAEDLRKGDKLYSQAGMGLIRGGLWTIADATPGYPSAGTVEVLFANRVVLRYPAGTPVEVVERGPAPLQETAPEPTAPLPEPQTPQELAIEAKRQAWLEAHPGYDRVPCAGCSADGVVPYGDPPRVWRCVECAERENAIAARAMREWSDEDDEREFYREAAALILAELLDRAESVAGSNDRRDMRRARMLYTAAGLIEVEFDLDESAPEVTSLRENPNSPDARRRRGLEPIRPAPKVTRAPEPERADPVQPEPADAPRLCELCEGALEADDDGDRCAECGVIRVGIPYAPVVEDEGPVERRVCPVCLEVTADYPGHWRSAGHVEVRPEVDGEFLVESRAQSTAAAWRMARGEAPPAGEWVA